MVKGKENKEKIDETGARGGRENRRERAGQRKKELK